MDLLLISLAVVVVAMVALAARWWVWRPLVKRRALVQTEAAAFDAVVMSRRGPLLVLADVKVRTPEGEQRIDGTVIVERASVQFVQVI